MGTRNPNPNPSLDPRDGAQEMRGGRGGEGEGEGEGGKKWAGRAGTRTGNPNPNPNPRLPVPGTTHLEWSHSATGGRKKSEIAGLPHSGRAGPIGAHPGAIKPILEFGGGGALRAPNPKWALPPNGGGYLPTGARVTSPRSQGGNRRGNHGHAPLRVILYIFLSKT